ncbi:MAG TPA: hypothetical protein VKH44_11460, partial [Pirellulaceae bacterium]|nr:hypothetical protein [Pirellulaceae bacterium]
QAGGTGTGKALTPAELAALFPPKTGGGTQAGQAGASSQGGKAASGAQSGTTGGTASSGSSASGGSTTTQSGTSTTTSDSETTAAPVVQLIGSATELRFDISRLPRVDQYKGIMASGGELSAVDLPSDVKTIAYFIRSESSAESYRDNPHAVGGEASTDGFGRGLMRTEMDRAVTTYAESGGGAASIYDSAQLLAEEVVGLGFEYFDGTDFLTEWDSTASGGLPRAIRIWLSIKPTYGMSEKELAQAAAGKEVPTTDFYFVISLPTAPLVATPAETETTDSTGTTGQSSTSSTTQGTTP